MKKDYPGIEHQRLEAQRKGEESWQLWGPYLAERAWGMVRDDFHGGWNYQLRPKKQQI